MYVFVLLNCLIYVFLFVGFFRQNYTMIYVLCNVFNKNITNQFQKRHTRNVTIKNDTNALIYVEKKACSLLI